MNKVLACVVIFLVLCPMLVAAAACNDGVDNDGDGLIDMDDMGCTSATANDENSAVRTCRTDFYSINGNIVLNPNMECDNNGDGSPDSWSLSGSAPMSSKWRSSVLGRNSKVLVAQHQGSVLSSYRQMITASRMKPNTWYEVSFDIAAENTVPVMDGSRLSDASFWAAFRFVTYDSTGTHQALDQMYGIYGPAYSDWDEAKGVYHQVTTRTSEPWRRVVSYVKSPAAIASPQVYSLIDYTDTSFYLDNVLIREVSYDLQAPKKKSGTLNFVKYKGADFFPIILEGVGYRTSAGGTKTTIGRDEIYNLGFNTLIHEYWNNYHADDSRFAEMVIFPTIYYTSSGGESWVSDPNHQITYTGWSQFLSYFNASAPNLLFVRLFDEITYPTYKGMDIGYMKPVEKAYNYIKQQSPNTVVFTNYNGYYADGSYTLSFQDLADYYFPYVDAASFTQNLPRYYEKNSALPEAYGLGTATRKYASFTDPSGKKKYYIAFGLGVPEWSSWDGQGSCPANSNPDFKCNEYMPFNLQRYQVWDQIINGAVGVTFWGLNNYCYLYMRYPEYGTLDPKYCDYQFSQAATITKEVSALKDVLLEQYYYDEWNVSNDNIDVMMKKHDGKIYLLTASTAFVDISGVTFSLPNYTIRSVRALREVDNGVISNVYNRTVAINSDGHSFTDNFIGENAQAIQGKAAPGYSVHIYEITADAIMRILSCTDAAWSYADGACQPSGTLVRTWTKINSTCQGGITRPATEPVSCAYGVAGDVNGDGHVDIADLVSVAVSFGKKSGDAGFNAKYDVVVNGAIDIADLSFVAMRFTG